MQNSRGRLLFLRKNRREGCGKFSAPAVSKAGFVQWCRSLQRKDFLVLKLPFHNHERPESGFNVFHSMKETQRSIIRPNTGWFRNQLIHPPVKKHCDVMTPSDSPVPIQLMKSFAQSIRKPVAESSSNTIVVSLWRKKKYVARSMMIHRPSIKDHF